MKTPPLPILVILLLAAVSPAITAPQTATSPDLAQTFPSEVEVVVVDAVVLDDDGRPVAGLTADDFTLKEDGQPQAISSFEAVQAATTAPEVRTSVPLRPRVERRIASNREALSRAVRSFVVVFDDAHLTRESAGHARDAVARFLQDGVGDGDFVTLVATAGGVWRSGRMPEARDGLLGALEGLEGREFKEPLRQRISDFEALRIHVFRDVRVAQQVERRLMGRGILDAEEAEIALEFEADPYDPLYTIDAYVAARASEAYHYATLRNQATFDAMERALSAQTLARGRKSLILVSEGFVYDPEVEELRRVGEAARRANVAIYFVDARGLLAMPSLFSAETERTGDPRGAFSEIIDIGYNVFQQADEAAGSESVASESGGFSIKNTNDLSSGIQRIAEESRTYYLLGYTPTDTRMDGDFRKIEVEVRGKGLKVRARKGYYAPEEDGSPGGRGWEADSDVQQALDAPYAIAHVPLRMTSYVLGQAVPGKASVLVAVDVDIEALDFEERDGRFVDTIEYLLTVIPREGGEPLRYDEKAGLNLLPQTRESLAVTGYRIVRDFELPIGSYDAKIVVRDKASGRIGTVSHEIEIPSTFQWRVSTPILSETLNPEPDPDSLLRAQPSARRVYQPGELLYCEFQVYRAAEDPSTRQPRVAAGYALQDGQGRTVFAVDPTTIRPTSSGTVSRIIGLKTESLPPGDYTLNLFVRDEVSGKVIEILEPFRLAPPEGPAQAASSGG